MAAKFYRGLGTIEMETDADEVDEELNISHIDVDGTTAGTFKITEKLTNALVGIFTASTYQMNKSIFVDRKVNGIVLSLIGGAAGTIVVYLKKKH
jgi:hypothetical protein